MHRRFLAECERERLHLSGHIQAHGALLRADAALRVTHLSANLAEHTDALGVTLGAPLPPSLADLADPTLLPAHAGARRYVPAGLVGRNGPLDVAIVRSDDDALLFELHPTAEPPPPDCGYPATGRPAPVEVPRDQDALRAEQQALVDRVFAASGFRRVMFYRFLNDGDGEVVAEAHDPAVYGSYLGLRFPASDIPQIARNLYQLNPWRLIPDASAAPVALLGDGNIPDLSRADLRSVSPVHQVYLANMGVRASLSLPVLVAGQLHGLIACHHHHVSRPSLALLESISRDVRNHGHALTSHIAQSRVRLIDGLMRHFVPMREEIERRGSLLAAWATLGPRLVAEFACEGAHLLVDDAHAGWGSLLEADALEHLDDWFSDSPAEPLWLSDHLVGDVPEMPLSRIAGVLAFKGRTAAGSRLRVYLTRAEHIHEVAWGGNPEKPVEHHDGTLGIAPRRSFEKWIEKRMGHSRPWENEARLLGLRLREMLLDVAHRP